MKRGDLRIQGQKSSGRPCQAQFASAGRCRGPAARFPAEYPWREGEPARRMSHREARCIATGAGISVAKLLAPPIRMSLATIGATLLVACFSAAQVFAGRALAPEDLVPIKVLAAITDSTTLAALEQVHGAAVAPDPATEIAYGLRLLELGDSNKAERVLLNSIPRNRLEYVVLTLIPDACQREGIQLSATVCMIPDHYFAVLGKIVAQRPSFYGAYLALSYFADGELKDELDHWNLVLEQSNRKAYKRALKCLPEAVSRTVCGDCRKELQR